MHLRVCHEAAELLKAIDEERPGRGESRLESPISVAERMAMTAETGRGS